MNYAAFRLADIRQKGVTITAVEDIGEDLPLQRIGEFNFLLHRLTDQELQLLDNGRVIDVGMTVDNDARFIVSVFDKNDPDDLKKKQRYQEWKKKQEKNQGDVCYDLGKRDNTQVERSRRLAIEEALLIVCCLLLFGLYVLVRLLFHEPGKEGAKII